MHCPAPARAAHGEADLRMALRHIAILPPPNTIEELVARLDETATSASPALAQIVQDARSANQTDSAEQGHPNFVRRVRDYSRTATSKATQLRSRWNRVIMASIVFGAVLVSTTPFRGPRPHLVTPTAHALNEIVSSTASKGSTRFDEEARALSTGSLLTAPSRGVRQVSDDALIRLVAAPPASSKKVRNLQRYKAPARQRALRAQDASFPAGLVCGLARMLRLRCNLRA
jgi:hypothetical protein